MVSTKRSCRPLGGSNQRFLNKRPKRLSNLFKTPLAKPLNSCHTCLGLLVVDVQIEFETSVSIIDFPMTELGSVDDLVKDLHASLARKS